MSTPHVLWRGLAVVVLLAALAAHAFADTPPPQNMTLVAAGQSIVGKVEESEPDDIMITASDGTLYFVWTPESYNESRLEAFYLKYRLKEVTLKGDVYRDPDGYLSLFVKELPE